MEVDKDSELDYFCFFKDPETTEIYTLSLHDALPICEARDAVSDAFAEVWVRWTKLELEQRTAAYVLGAVHYHILKRLRDRKSTRLNSSHGYISYAVFCLKKKKNTYNTIRITPLLSPC